MSSDRFEGRDPVEAPDSATPGAVIEARSLCKSYQVYAHPQERLWQMLWRGRRTFYREFQAVRDIDLAIYPGETVGVVGRNGSGKSTLLKMICNTLTPTSGELVVKGHVAPLLTLGAGFNPEFTGRENVFMNAAVLGLSESEIKERLESIIDFAGIGAFFDQPVKSYSSGMYSRLAFAVAINADPDILVIDEILAVGDEAFNRKCFARIDEIKESGSTILFASHSASAVIELCDRAVLLESGARILTADPKTVISHYQKLIYAPPAKTSAIVREISELDGGLSRTHEVVPERAGNQADTGVSAAVADDPDDFGRFDPNLTPESTVEYERNGAFIHNTRLLAPNGRPVNVLREGKVYTYAYDVTFMQAALGVRFGMMLKLVSGFELGGQVSHPKGEGVECIEAGSTVHVRFQFLASLVPGAYFLNAGVRGFREGGEDYLHRILDAVMFRIEADPSGTVTGQVDLSPGRMPEVEFALRNDPATPMTEAQQ